MQLDTTKWEYKLGDLRPKMRCEKNVEFEKRPDYAPALYALLAAFVVSLLLALLCCGYTVLGIGTWNDFSVVTRVFSLDKRSIALGRIVLGCISLYDLYFSHSICAVFLHGPGHVAKNTDTSDANNGSEKRGSPYMFISTYTQVLVVVFCVVGSCCLSAIVSY